MRNICIILLNNITFVTKIYCPHSAAMRVQVSGLCTVQSTNSKQTTIKESHTLECHLKRFFYNSHLYLKYFVTIILTRKKS